MRRLASACVMFAAVSVHTGVAAGQIFVTTAPGSLEQSPLTGPFDGPKPEFEVASVRPDAGPADRLSITSPPGRFSVTGLPLQSLLTLAYRVRPDQLEGAPGWAETERFDINAKMPDGAPQDQMPLMLQSLLEDRFGLEWHTETREGDIYALVLARDDGRLGPALTRSDTDCRPILEARQKALADARERRDPPEALAAILRTAPGETPQCTTRMSMRAPDGGGLPAMTMSTQGTELSTLAGLLTGLSGRPVVDRTGLTGAFDFEFTFSPSGGTALAAGLAAGRAAAAGQSLSLGARAGAGVPTGPGPAVPTAALADGPTVFQALEEQLGLKLQSERGPLLFFVVDSIERPDPD